MISTRFGAINERQFKPGFAFRYTDNVKKGGLFDANDPGKDQIFIVRSVDNERKVAVVDALIPTRGGDAFEQLAAKEVPIANSELHDPAHGVKIAQDGNGRIVRVEIEKRPFSVTHLANA